MSMANYVGDCCDADVLVTDIAVYLPKVLKQAIHDRRCSQYVAGSGQAKSQHTVDFAQASNVIAGYLLCPAV